MGRLILLILLVLAVYLVWKAFGPSSWKKPEQVEQRPAIKGPDDDEEFLWKLEKERFKERRAREMQAEREAEERRRQQRRESHRDEPSRDETDEK